MGSIRDARCAGIHAATRAAPINRTITVAYVVKSRGWTPNSRLARAREATTAAATLIGNHSVPGANALVFAADGTLYAAGFQLQSLFTINPATGAGASLGNISAASGGDLAFNGGNLFLATTSNQLFRIDLTNLAASAAVGPFGVGNVFGLATGDDGVLYAVAGTQTFTVNTATGAATNPINYGGQGLGSANGQSFFTEAGAPSPSPVPEPTTLFLLGSTLTGMGLAAWRRRRQGSPE